MIFIKKGSKAQGMVEYALILVLIAVVVIAALTISGPLISDIFNTINASLGGVVPEVIPTTIP